MTKMVVGVAAAHAEMVVAVVAKTEANVGENRDSPGGIDGDSSGNVGGSGGDGNGNGNGNGRR